MAHIVKATTTTRRSSKPAAITSVAVSMAQLTAIPDGKVIDFITGQLLNDTPEEYVRQNIAMSLVLEYGYDRNQIEVEFKIKVGSGSKWVDLAIFPSGAPHDQQNISIIVETKKQGTKRDDKKDGVGQLQSYMAASLNAEYGMWTNGEDRACYLKGADKGDLRFIDSIDIPTQGSKKAESPTRDSLRPATGDKPALRLPSVPQLHRRQPRASKTGSVLGVA